MNELDVGAMNAGAALLEGVHDFAAFGQPPAGSVTVRNVYRASWRVATCNEWDTASRLTTLYRFEIEANAFLRGMVRRIVGTLLRVGLGLLSPHDVAEVLASRDISRAAPPAPACGLHLLQVCYREQGMSDAQ